MGFPTFINRTSLFFSSKAVVLLLIYCCMYCPYLWEFCVCFWHLFCYSVLSFLLVLQSSYEEERAGRFTVIVFLMACNCYCSVALHRGDVGCSV